MLRELLRHAHYLAARRGALALVFVLGLAGAAVSLATPLLGMAFVDAVATRGDYAAIPFIAAALVALAAADLALAIVSGRIHARLSSGLLAEMRAALFDRCTNAPLEAVEGFRHGDLLTRFGTDVPRIQVLLVDGVLGAVQNVLFLVVAAAITFSLSPPLALWSFVGLALALLATAAFRRPVEHRSARVRDAMADLSHFLAERLGALRAIRFHRAEDEEGKRLAGASGRLNREVVAYQGLDAAATGVPGLVLALALAWIYLRAGSLLQAGTISLGTFVAFVLYQARLFAPAQGLLGLARHLQEARVSVERVGELLGPAETRTDESPAPPADRVQSSPSSDDVKRAAARPQAAIEFRDVTFAYPGKAPVLRELDFAIAAGERVGLFGASGAGKSTLVQLLFGLREPGAGAVRVAGRHARQFRSGVDRALLGYANAEPFLLHASVEENVRYGNPSATVEDVARALVLAEAAAFVTALPEGLATIIGGRGLALSDGQRQRLGLVRLFLRNPRILVLDEAFSGIDLETEARIRANLWAAFPDRAAVVVSHRPVGLDELDRIFFLHDGRLTTVAPDELKALLVADRAWT